MEKDKLYEYAERIRRELHELVDRQLDDFVKRMENEEPIGRADIVRSLDMPAFSFKGTKPVAVCLPNGEKISCRTWREATAIILHDCDKAKHEKLLAISGKVAGRSRIILGKTAEGMSRPVKIGDGIYFESYFDTEYLLKMMKENVLKKVGYDYSAVKIQIRRQEEILSPENEAVQCDTEDQPDEEPDEDQSFSLMM